MLSRVYLQMQIIFLRNGVLLSDERNDYMLNISPADILIYTPITLMAITVHELAHGLVSTKLGDPTPRYEGRLTLNPLAHLDIVGTLLMIFTGFGWAKPVGVNPMYYKNKKRGMALVALAGPASNFIMAVIGVILAHILGLLNMKLGTAMYGGFTLIILKILQVFIFRNLSFMVFNLIPIPPLDGAKILGMFLPDYAYEKMLQYERYSMLLILLLSGTGVFSRILSTGIYGMFNIISAAVGTVFGLFM